MSAPLREIGYANPRASGYWPALEQDPTPELRWPHSVRVYQRMRRQDAQVISVLKAVTLPVLRTGWRVDPAGARPEVVALVAEDLGLPIAGQEDRQPSRRSRGRFSWQQHIEWALKLSLAFGHMYFEQQAVVDDAGMVRLRKLAPRMPSTLSAINVERDGGLKSIEQHFAQRPIQVNRLVAYVHDQDPGDWVGTSVLRSAYKNWLLKDRLLRVDAQVIERNGMGVPLYTGAEGELDLEPGRKMAQDWRSGDASGAAVAHGANLALRGVEGTLPPALPSIRYHDEQIARSALLHFLNLGTQTGSWALGTTFADFFTYALQTQAEWVRGIATAHVVEDIVDWNWGPDEPAPRIECDEIGSRHAATAEAIKLLLDSGALSQDQALERHLRQEYGLPAADPDTARPAPEPDDQPDQQPDSREGAA